MSNKRISNIDDEDDENASLCKIHYEQTLDEELRSYQWNAAEAEAKLAQKPEEESPLFDYQHAYALPNDPYCLRVLRINDSLENFRVSGRLVFTDEDPVNLRYTKRITNIAEMDALLVKTLYYQLAIKISFPITQSMKIGEKLLRDYETLVAPLAKFIDSIEHQDILIERSNFIESRGSGLGARSGFTRD